MVLIKKVQCKNVKFWFLNELLRRSKKISINKNFLQIKSDVLKMELFCYSEFFSGPNLCMFYNHKNKTISEMPIILDDTCRPSFIGALKSGDKNLDKNGFVCGYGIKPHHVCLVRDQMTGILQNRLLNMAVLNFVHMDPRTHEHYKSMF